MKPSPLISALFVLCASTLYANWGGDSGGNVATGAFRAVGTNQIEMQTENLNIRLFHDRAKVQVDYVLKNTGDAVDVTAGFPCLHISTKQDNCNEIEDYQLTADGKHMPYRTQKGDVKNWLRLFDQDFLDVAKMSYEDSVGAPEILWLSSTVHFEKGES